MTPERRGKFRLQSKDLTFVAVRPEFVNLGRLLDISKDGLCFQYMSKEGQVIDGATFNIDIFINRNGYYLSRVPCRLIYDREINEGTTFPIGLEYRRCGLQFQRLTKEQADGLALYLKIHTV